MNDYNQEQSETIAMVRHHLGTRLPSELESIKAKIRDYLQFRQEVDEFLECYFSGVCTQKCYQDAYSACCNREGITTFFTDIVINVLVSTEQEVDRLLGLLNLPNQGLKCIYLRRAGCSWRVKPLVCAMFLCEPARKSVFGDDPHAQTLWQRLRHKEKKFTWPDRPVLFDALEADYIREGYTSNLMYFHNSPGLLRVKSMAAQKTIKGGNRD